MYGEILKTEYAPAKYAQNGEAQICVRPVKTYSIKTVRNVHRTKQDCKQQAIRDHPSFDFGGITPARAGNSRP